MDYPSDSLPEHVSRVDWDCTPDSIRSWVQALLVKCSEVDRKQVEENLRLQFQREQALNRVFQAIRNSLDLEIIFATATQEAAQLLNLDCHVVQYLPGQGVWKHVATFQHHSADARIQGLEIPDQGNPFAEQLKQLKIVRVEDTNTLEDQINQTIAQTVPGAWLLIPLVIDGTVWGSFTISSQQRPLAWSHEQIELAQAIADQLEVAIQQANLYQQTQLELAERRRAEAALRESEARFQKLADNVPGIIFGYCLSPDGSDRFIYISSGFRDLYGIDPDSALAESSVVWRMTHPDDVSILQESVKHSLQTLETWNCQYRVMTPGGQLKWLQGISRPVLQKNGDVIWDGIIIDITEQQAALRERQEAEVALQQSEARYRLLAENMNDLVCLHTPDGRFTYVSPSCETLLGYRYDEMVGQDPYHFFHPDDRQRVFQEAHSAALVGKPTPITYRMRQKSGQYLWFETLTKPIFDAAGNVVKLQTTSREVTERVLVQNRLRYEAVHDSLTGLPNRNLLMERLELAINRAKRVQDYLFAVLFLDLDRFKVINDSLGHLVGDQLLVAIAQKLQSILRSTDLAVRLGGDEFVILLEGIKGIQEVVRATERIFAELQEPLIIEGREVYTTASIGIVFGTQIYEQASDLLRDADIAMYRAKNQGKARYEIFDAAMHTQALERLHLENDLRQAIERQEFLLHYQPIVELQSHTLVGFEALIRWQHPVQGVKFPGEFIEIAEETGLITLMDYWALQTACHQFAQWQRSFSDCALHKISVNLSVRDLRRADLLETIDQVLADTQLEGRFLNLEITESMLIEDVEATILLFEQLKERGIQISIDDFGTGYSSLGYLHLLPVDSLKVDRSFVHQIQSGSRNHQIVKTIVALGNQVGLDTIAEGIETPQQLEQLRELGYKFGQGYLFAKPLSFEAATTFLKHGFIPEN